ncbi:MAG: GIY-YIG nuclease family protein, partial [Candidatus Staskawiczbacteria bacterium]|nr:GIY-YIG nuclease family protein [Candidatus Staskawiczbacteria bacterium]
EDFESRIKKHNAGLVKSTKARMPFILIRKENYNTRSEARIRENYLKKMKGGNEFKKIIGII